MRLRRALFFSIIAMIKKETILQEISAGLEEQGLIILDYIAKDVRGVGSKVDVVLAKRQGGVSHDDCSFVTKQIFAAAEKHGDDPQDYSISVSSPGLSRKLKHDIEFELFSDAPVRVHLMDSNVLNGKNKGLKGAVLELEDENGKILEIEKDSIKYVKLNY